MKIALVSQGYPPWYCVGTAILTQYLAEGLAAMGHVVHVVCDGDRLSRRLAPNLTVHFIPSRPVEGMGNDAVADTFARSLAVHRALNAIGSETGLDIAEGVNWRSEGLVHASYGATPVVVRLVTPLWVEAEVAKDAPPMQWRERAGLEAVFLRQCAGYIAITHAVRKTVDECYGLRPELPCANVPVGLPVNCGEPIHPLDESGPFRMLFLGRLEPRKGVRALFEAIPRVLARNKEIQFEIAARPRPDLGYSEEFVKNFCTQHGRVTFHGEVDELTKKELLCHCHVLVAPSLYESFGIVYIEAMAHARATIGCRVGGVPEVVADGISGILVEPDHAGQLAEAILAFAGDRNRCAKMGQVGYDIFREQFTLEHMVHGTLSLYERVLASRRLQP